MLLLLPQRYVFSSKSQPLCVLLCTLCGCCCYHKGTYFQANHNPTHNSLSNSLVVVATTKVRIFKQITTGRNAAFNYQLLLLLPQRYVFSSKSQQSYHNGCNTPSCCCYHKGTYFQANHNEQTDSFEPVTLLLLPQRYVFSSKSQHALLRMILPLCCCCYHKGTYFQANHN